MATIQGNNIKRAMTARHAYRRFVAIVDPKDSNDKAINMMDLLSDLMHLCEEWGIDIEKTWCDAQEHYLYERENPHE